MADSTSAVVRWSARSATVGTPRGRFSVLPGLGIGLVQAEGSVFTFRIQHGERLAAPEGAKKVLRSLCRLEAGYFLLIGY